MNERELTETGPLLDDEGRLRERGWARRLLRTYDRSAIRAPAWRVKEWDYYCVLSQDHGLALTVADNGYMGFLAATVFDFRLAREESESLMTAFPLGKFRLPASSAAGVTEAASGGASFRFESSGGERRLRVSWPSFGAASALKGQPRASCCVELPPEVLAEARREAGPRIAGVGLEAEILLREQPAGESLVIATPFRGSGRRFYYNQKINCLEASGSFRLGKRDFALEPGKAFGVLDWGRGVWPWSNTWYWASASGLVAGERFGFNLGYGFGDTSAASENALLFQGRVHKLGRTSFELDGRNFLKPWRARSEDGRLDLVLQPELDRASTQDFGLIASIQHQVFGTWSGRAILDDGRELRIEGFRGFAEKVVNRW